MFSHKGIFSLGKHIYIQIESQSNPSTFILELHFPHVSGSKTVRTSSYASSRMNHNSLVGHITRSQVKRWPKVPCWNRAGDFKQVFDRLKKWQCDVVVVISNWCTSLAFLSSCSSLNQHFCNPFSLIVYFTVELWVRMLSLSSHKPVISQSRNNGPHSAFSNASGRCLNEEKIPVSLYSDWTSFTGMIKRLCTLYIAYPLALCSCAWLTSQIPFTLKFFFHLNCE